MKKKAVRNNKSTPLGGFLLTAQRTARNGICGWMGCGEAIPKGTYSVVVTVRGSQQAYAYCRNHGVRAINREYGHLFKVERAVYGGGGA